MSASLVGSEMCIRDSSTSGLPSAAGAPRPGIPRVGQCTLAPREDEPPVCLLYTSDAADDM
eukprot:1135366-Alexandrium_andersonii.AAC.1